MITWIDKKGDFERNDLSSEFMNDRDECISAERNQIMNKIELNENSMNTLAECLENYN